MRAFAAVVAGLLLSLASGVAIAENETTEVLTVGHGATPKEAIADALAEAVRQVNGISVDASEFLRSSTMAVSASDASGPQEQFKASTEVRQGVDTKGAGLIASYDVLSNDPSETGYAANVRARVLRYVPPGNNSSEDRRRLAVLPRASMRARYDVHSSLSGDELTDRYVTALEGALVQSRRFAVLDRAENAALDEERARWRSSDAPLAEQAKLGQSLGVDYLLFTRILDARAGVSTEHITLTDEYISHPYADMKVDLRLVLAATGEVKFADSVALGLGELGGADAQTMVNRMANCVSNLVTERIYPLQIIGRQEKVFILNQGGSSVKIGEQFRVIQRGAPLTDPYTHEALGFTESEVGTIQVTRVDARVAYARQLDGAPGSVQTGMTLRRAGQAAAPRRRSGPPPEPATGVKLPFDR